MVSVRTLREEKVMSFKSDLKPYNTVGRFKFWCQKVLPTVYDNSLSYYEVLNKIVKYLNDLIENIDTVEDNVDILASEIASITADIEALPDEVKRLAFAPLSFKGNYDGISWFMFNTGDDTPNPVPQASSKDVALAYCTANFVDNLGEHEPEIFFELTEDEKFSLNASNTTLYYLYIMFSGTQQMEYADLFFTDSVFSNNRIGEDAISLTTGFNLIPISGELLSGIADGRNNAEFFGIKFYNTGRRSVKCGLIKAGSDSFTSLYAGYIRNISASLDNAFNRITGLSDAILNLQRTVPVPPSVDGEYILKTTVVDGVATSSWVNA